MAQQPATDQRPGGKHDNRAYAHRGTSQTGAGIACEQNLQQHNARGQAQDLGIAHPACLAQGQGRSSEEENRQNCIIAAAFALIMKEQNHQYRHRVDDQAEMGQGLWPGSAHIVEFQRRTDLGVIAEPNLVDEWVHGSHGAREEIRYPQPQDGEGQNAGGDREA